MPSCCTRACACWRRDQHGLGLSHHRHPDRRGRPGSATRPAARRPVRRIMPPSFAPAQIANHIDLSRCLGFVWLRALRNTFRPPPSSGPRTSVHPAGPKRRAGVESRRTDPAAARASLPSRSGRRRLGDGPTAPVGAPRKSQRIEKARSLGFVWCSSAGSRRRAVGFVWYFPAGAERRRAPLGSFGSCPPIAIDGTPLGSFDRSRRAPLGSSGDFSLRRGPSMRRAGAGKVADLRNFFQMLRGSGNGVLTLCG